MIVLTVLLLIIHQTEIRFVPNQKGNCQHDNFPWHFIGSENCISQSGKEVEKYSQPGPTGKTTTTVRETCVPLHHGGPIENPPETS